MAIDLKNLTPKQLEELINKAEQQRTKLHRERRDEVKRKLTDMAKAEGYSVEELFGFRRGRKSPAAGRKVAPKYRNPADPSQTWSGRGKRPRWFNDALAKGKKEKDLLI